MCEILPNMRKICLYLYFKILQLLGDFVSRPPTGALPLPVVFPPSQTFCRLCLKPGLGSLKVIGTDTDRSATCLSINVPYHGPISYLSSTAIVQRFQTKKVQPSDSRLPFPLEFGNHVLFFSFIYLLRKQYKHSGRATRPITKLMVSLSIYIASRD